MKNEEDLPASVRGQAGNMDGYKDYRITMKPQKTEMSSNNLPPVVVEKWRKNTARKRELAKTKVGRKVKKIRKCQHYGRR